MQRGLVVSYRPFGTTCRSHIQGSSSPVAERKLAVNDVLGQPVAPIFSGQAALLRSVDWYLATFWGNLSLSFSGVKQPCCVALIGS